MTYYLRADNGDRAWAESLGHAIDAATDMVRRSRVKVTLHGGATGPALMRVYEQETIRGDRIVMVGR